MQPVAIADLEFVFSWLLLLGFFIMLCGLLGKIRYEIREHQTPLEPEAHIDHVHEKEKK